LNRLFVAGALAASAGGFFPNSARVCALPRVERCSIARARASRGQSFVATGTRHRRVIARVRRRDGAIARRERARARRERSAHLDGESRRSAEGDGGRRDGEHRG